MLFNIRTILTKTFFLEIMRKLRRFSDSETHKITFVENRKNRQNLEVFRHHHCPANVLEINFIA